MGRQKMVYCIDCRDMQTALHFLIGFDTREEAEKWIDILDNAKHTSEYSDVCLNCVDSCLECLPEIDYREIKTEYYTVKGEKKMRRVYNKVYLVVNLVFYDMYLGF